MAPRGRPPKIQALQMNNPVPAVPNSHTEKLPLNAQDVNPVNTIPSLKAIMRMKKANATSPVVRRSKRINSPTQVDSEELIAEDTIVSEVEKDEAVNQENNLSEATKDTPPSQPSSPVEVTGMANLNYKTMYIKSQKKVRLLMKKNKRLKKELKFALGKIEGYAEMTPILASLTKANEILCNRPWNLKRLRS